MIKKFSRKLEERTELFTIYSKSDKEIVKKGSEFGFYLIGGTAIEIWLNYLGIKGWRRRSNNDIDFLFDESDIDEYSGTDEFYEWLNNNVDLEKVQVDWLSNNDNLPEFLYCKIDGIKVMHPYYLFFSKYERLQGLDIRIDSERVEKDINDLKDILKIINKIDNGFIKFQSYVDKSRNKKLNELVKSLIREVI